MAGERELEAAEYDNQAPSTIGLYKLLLGLHTLKFLDQCTKARQLIPDSQIKELWF